MCGISGETMMWYFTTEQTKEATVFTQEKGKKQRKIALHVTAAIDKKEKGKQVQKFP